MLKFIRILTSIFVKFLNEFTNMRWIITLIILLIITIFLEFYAFQALKTVSKNKIIRYSWIFISFVAYLNFFFIASTYDRSQGQTPQFQMAFGIMLTVLLPKLVIILVSIKKFNLRNVFRLKTFNRIFLIRLCC